MMRRILYTLLLLSFSFVGFAQSNQTIKNVKVTQKSKLIGDVTIGSSSFDGSALLTMTSTDQGILIPRMTTAQRDAIGTPAAGLMVYNIDNDRFEFFESTWQAVSGVVADSSFIEIQWDTVKAFNNAALQFNDPSVFNDPVGIGSQAVGANLLVQNPSGISPAFIAKFEANGGSVKALIVSDDGNVGIGTETFGTNAAGIVALKVGTAPSSNVTDVLQIYTTTGLDLNVRDEDGTVTDLLAGGGGDGNGIYDASGALSGATTVTMAGNGLTFSSTGDANNLVFQSASANISIGAAADNGSKLNITGGGGQSPFKVDASGSLNTLFVTSAGDVGIGTSSPGAKAEIFELAPAVGFNNLLEYDYTNYGNAIGDGIAVNYSTFNTIGTDLSSASNIDFYWSTWNGAKVERMRLEGGGNLGIGIADPTAQLHVSSPQSFGNQFLLESDHTSGTTVSIKNTSVGGKTWSIFSNGSGNLGGAGHIQFFDGSTTPFFLHKDGKMSMSSGAGFVPTYGLDMRFTNNNEGIALAKSGTFHAFLLTSAIGGYLQLRDASGATSVVRLNDNNGAYDFVNTGRNLGVGLTTPSAKLQVAGVNAAATSDALLIEDNVGTDLLIVENGGDVGIGLSDPSVRLEITSGGDDDGITVNAADGDLGFSISPRSTDGTILRLGDAAGNADVLIRGGTSGGNTYFAGGNEVAIGTTSSNNTLSVRAISDGKGITVNSLTAGTARIELAAFNSTGRLDVYDSAPTSQIRWRADGNDNYVNAGNTGFGNTSPTSKVDVSGDVEIGSANAYYLGDPTTDGSWRFIRSGDDLLMQQREAGVWNTKSTISGA